MFTFFYNNINYRCAKSGFLLDFYFKGGVYSLLFIFYYYFNVLFSEKYFIEHNFLKILVYINYFKNFINVYSQQFSVAQVGFMCVLSLLVVYLSLFV